ncbi:MAG TPA: sulfite exporter TauE/SafE family protein [Ktedonobacteraceae bacterium]|nr:sulfite exporter TauE/SafE family protein [Ktedonobacteraceae bacterium]
MTFPSIVLLFLSAVIGGALNAVAGGGSFFTFPALAFSGVPSVPANATSTLALWPASLASAGAYRKVLLDQDRTLLILLCITSLVGGVLGAILLIKTPSKIFQVLLPYLLLFATLLFTFSPMITTRLRKRRLEKEALTPEHPLPQELAGEASTPEHPLPQELAGEASTPEHPVQRGPGKEALTPGRLVWMCAIQLIISIYGGYFGGGIGIMMLASLAMMGLEEMHVMNAIKNVLASFINGIAIVTFIVYRIIYWPQALIMIVGSIVGGYGSALYTRKIASKYIRAFVIIVGFSMAVIFFFRA